MGWFECSRCGRFANSDDGCWPDPDIDNRLICEECPEIDEEEYERIYEYRTKKNARRDKNKGYNYL